MENPSLRQALNRLRAPRIACRKCNSRKVKCSGGIPCSNCDKAGDAAGCTYPSRNNVVKVEQKLIDELVNEIYRLRQSASESEASESVVTDKEDPQIHDEDPGPLESRHSDTELRNPILDIQPWSFALTLEVPMLIGDASDLAFSTRLRQDLVGHSQTHILRMENLKDATIISSWNQDTPWPTPSRARFLLKVALSTACQRHYIVRKSHTEKILEQAINGPEPDDLLTSCKLNALFALGEVYSARVCVHESRFPGLHFYTNASHMLRALNEQPRIECVEVLLMLGLYNLLMNRRHSAYCIIGCAMRFSIILGLHLGIPQSQVHREILEHRNRLWWTAYTFDRSWALLHGKPVSIRDEDITTRLPSTEGLTPESLQFDFAGTDYQIATVRLARLSADTMTSIYTRRTQDVPFFDRVQSAVRSISAWLQALPPTLRESFGQMSSATPMPIVTLYLTFNQCLILASRPVLLHALRLRQNAPPNIQAGEHITALADACLRCGRETFKILSECWIHGTFPSYDFMYTRSLFSCSTILAISSLLGTPDSRKDGDDFDTAADILSQLDQSGNFAAKEFSKHVQAIQSILSTKRATLNTIAATTCVVPTDARAGPSTDNTATEATTFTEDFLVQSGIDQSLLDPSMIEDGFQAFLWTDWQ